MEVDFQEQTLSEQYYLIFNTEKKSLQTNEIRMIDVLDCE